MRLARARGSRENPHQESARSPLVGWTRSKCRPQQSCLARSIRAQQAGDLPGRHCEGDPFDATCLPVRDGEVVNAEGHFGHIAYAAELRRQPDGYQRDSLEETTNATETTRGTRMPREQRREQVMSVARGCSSSGAITLRAWMRSPMPQACPNRSCTSTFRANSSCTWRCSTAGSRNC